MATINLNTLEDFYSALGVPPDSSTKQIKLAFRRLAQKYDPAQGAPISFAERFKKITAAYLTLTNIEERAAYDKINGYLDWSSDAFSAVKQARGILKRFFHEGQSSHEIPIQNTTREIMPTKGKDIEVNDQNIIEEDPFAYDISMSPDINISLEDPFISEKDFLTHEVFSEPAEEFNFREDLERVVIPHNLPPGSLLHLELPPDLKAPHSNGTERHYQIEIFTEPLVSNDEKDIIINLPLTYAESLNGAQLVIPSPSGSFLLVLPQAFPAGTALKFIGMGFANGEVGNLIIKPYVELPRSNSQSAHVKLREKIERKREYLIAQLSS